MEGEGQRGHGTKGAVTLRIALVLGLLAACGSESERTAETPAPPAPASTPESRPEPPQPADEELARERGFDCAALPALPIGRPFAIAPPASGPGTTMVEGSEAGVRCQECDPDTEAHCDRMAYYRLSVDAPSYLNLSGVVETYFLEVVRGCAPATPIFCDATQGMAHDGASFTVDPGTYVIGFAADVTALDGEPAPDPRADVMRVDAWDRLCEEAPELRAGRSLALRSIGQSVVTGGCEYSGGDDALVRLPVDEDGTLVLDSRDAKSITVFRHCPRPASRESLSCVVDYGESGPLRLTTSLAPGNYWVLVETGRTGRARIRRAREPRP